MEPNSILKIVIFVASFIIGIVGLMIKHAHKKQSSTESNTCLISNIKHKTSENKVKADGEIDTSSPIADITINYTGSGVKTLSGFGTFFIASSLISLLAALILLADKNWIGVISCMVGALSCLATGGICKGLSTIAKASLYSIHIAKKEYKIQDSE